MRSWYTGHVPEVATRANEKLSTMQAVQRMHVDELDSVYAYLFGLYLGDGCVSHQHRGVFKLRIFLDVRYPEIITECRDAIAMVLPARSEDRRRVEDEGCVEVYSCLEGLALPSAPAWRGHEAHPANRA